MLSFKSSCRLSGYKNGVARTGTAFILGFSFGALSVVLIQALTGGRREDDPEQILDRLSDQLSELEAKTKEAVAKPS